MKKIFSKYFVVAVVAVAMGCISSCKDFEDEMYSELRGQDVALKKDLDEQIGKLRQEMKDSLQKARDEREALQAALDDHIQKAEEKYQELKDADDQLKQLIQDNADADAATKRELEQKIAAANTRIDSLNTEIEGLISRIGDVEGRLNALDQEYAKITYVDSEIQKVKDMFEDYYTAAEVDELLSKDKLAETLFGSGEGTDPVADAIVNIINQQFQVGGIENLDDLRKLAAKADSTATANATKIATMDSLINEIKQCNCPALVERVEALESRIDTLSGIEETKALANQAQQKAEQYAKEYTDAALNAILDYVNPRFTSIEEMLAEFYTQIQDHADQLLAHDASIAALKDSVNLLRADLTSLEERVKKNEEAIASLTDRVQNIEDALNNRISSIVLQATKSPVIGYFNIPMGIKSNVLAAYYGEAKNDVYFPTVRTSNLISGKAFTDEEAALLGFSGELFAGEGETLIDDAEGNAGTLYVTINPAEVKLDGITFSLVNSLEEVSYVTLSDFEESKEKLSFGYTRAENGFYEAKATISAEDAAAAKIRVDLNDVKDLASDLKSSVENLNVNFTSIASNLQSIVNDVADATALKASWEDNASWGEGRHNVYSEYALAALTVKPLSFQFMQNYEMKNFPGITRVSNFINNAIDKINIEISIDKIDKIEISDIDVPSFDELGINTVVNTFVTIEGTEYPIEVPVKDIVEDLYNGMTEPFDNVNEMLADLEKQVNDMLEQLNAVNDIEQSITDAKNDIKKELNGYLERLNNKLCGVINSVHDRLQPNMLLKTEDGFAMLSQVANKPTVLNAANCILVPTTYTGELLVPAFKKYVAVVNVKDAAGNDVTAAEIANVNTGNLNTVLAGSTTNIEFAGKSGYTYELVYSALDYSGKYSNVRYYVTVK